MKKIALLLAIYILALSVVPCNDVHAISDIYSTGNILTQDENNHEHPLDMCSPFCSCDCCHTVAETVFQTQIIIENCEISAVITPYFYTEKESFFSLWRPPIL